MTTLQNISYFSQFPPTQVGIELPALTSSTSCRLPAPIYSQVHPPPPPPRPHPKIRVQLIREWASSCGRRQRGEGELAEFPRSTECMERTRSLRRRAPSPRIRSVRSMLRANSPNSSPLSAPATQAWSVLEILLEYTKRPINWNVLSHWKYHQPHVH